MAAGHAACRVCKHPARIRIEARHVGGVTLDALQAEFGIQRDASHRHCKNHVTKIAKVNYLAGPVQIATLAQAAARENKSILEYLSVIRSILMQQLVKCAEKGNARTVGQISGSGLPSAAGPQTPEPMAPTVSTASPGRAAE